MQKENDSKDAMLRTSSGMNSLSQSLHEMDRLVAAGAEGDQVFLPVLTLMAPELHVMNL